MATSIYTFNSFLVLFLYFLPFAAAAEVEEDGGGNTEQGTGIRMGPISVVRDSIPSAAAAVVRL